LRQFAEHGTHDLEYGSDTYESGQLTTQVSIRFLAMEEHLEQVLVISVHSRQFKWQG